MIAEKAFCPTSSRLLLRRLGEGEGEEEGEGAVVGRVDAELLCPIERRGTGPEEGVALVDGAEKEHSVWKAAMSALAEAEAAAAAPVSPNDEDDRAAVWLSWISSATEAV